jgi:hypothetical protein
MYPPFLRFKRSRITVFYENGWFNCNVLCANRLEWILCKSKFCFEKEIHCRTWKIRETGSATIFLRVFTLTRALVIPNACQMAINARISYVFAWGGWNWGAVVPQSPASPACPTRPYVLSCPRALRLSLPPTRCLVVDPNKSLGKKIHKFSPLNIMWLLMHRSWRIATMSFSTMISLIHHLLMFGRSIKGHQNYRP